MSQIADEGPGYVVGKLVVDNYDAAKLTDAMMKLKRLLIVANTPGVDARSLATAWSQLGVTSEILNADPSEAPKVSRMTEVLAHMTTGDLDRADAIAAESIAAGDRAADMRHQRAMIALMRGDEAAADAELAQIDTPQALSSRAIIAAKRGDAAAMDYAKRAVAQLPGDVIAIRAAISVHALAGDHAGAHALLAEHGHHLEAGLRAALDAAIDDPAVLTETVRHRFPEHAQMVLDAVAPMVTAGDFAAAETLLKRARGWDPDNIGIAVELGFALSQQAKDDEAIAAYDEAIDRGGAANLLRFNRANCLLRRRSFTQAAADFRVCLEIKPDWHEARVNLTSALFASGDTKAAKAEVAQLERLGGPPQHIQALRQMLAGRL
jgi:tetratricopeptide (TPR) repeat protein